METNKNIFFIPVIFFTVVIFAAFIVPELYALTKLNPFTWQNSWDKCTYFSYQGVLAARSQPGTFLLWIIGWLQELGISGSTQTVIFDVTLPALMFVLLYKTFRALNISRTCALAYVNIIVFSSVLFNFCNPMVQKHFSQASHFEFFLVGWETYPSVLRAPNPQFSYFLLSLFIYLTVRYKKLVFLVLPIPLLYYFIFVPYVYLLIVSFVIFKTDFARSNARLLLINFLVYVALATAVWLMFSFLGGISQFIKNSNIFQWGHYPHLNLVGSVGIILYCGIRIFGFIQEKDTLGYVLLSLILCSFAITNLQLINGFSLDLKDFQDYGNSLIGGLMLVLSLQLIASNSAMNTYLPLLSYIASLLILFFVAKYTCKSQGFNFNTLNFTINLGATITEDQWQQIQKDPLHAIVLDERLSEFIPFSSPKMLAPVFSYQYNYPFFEKRCSYNQKLASNAADFIKQHCYAKTMDCAALQLRIDHYFASVQHSKSLPYRDQFYCNKAAYSAKTFYFIQPTPPVDPIIFPKWS